MVILGVLIGIGAAIAFLLVGALTLFGGTDATNRQVIPGFAPDQPPLAERLFALLSLWAPIAIVAILCLLAAIQIVRVLVAALL